MSLKEINDSLNLIKAIEKGETPTPVGGSDSSFADAPSFALREFVAGYLTAALWSSSDVDEEGNDINLDDYVFEQSSKEALSKVAMEFFQEHEQLIADFVEETGRGYDYAGHSFWLTHNGHGAGFFDYHTDAADALNEICKNYSEIYLQLGDDELVYCSGCENVKKQ